MSLSPEQKNLLREFVYEQIPSIDEIISTKKGTRGWSREKLGPITKEYFKGATEFSTLHDAIKDPKKFAGRFKLNPDAKDEINAARRYLKILAKDPFADPYNVDRWYDDKVNKSTSPKNALINRCDPVQSLPENPTPLDVILANTHFLTPQSKWTTTITDNEQSTTSTVIYEIPREETRKIIKDEFTKLWQSEDTRHVMEALGVLIHNEKGNILFGSDSFMLGNLGSKHGASGDMSSGLDFYNDHHSIFLRSIVSPSSKEIQTNTIGSFIHESLHFLFNRIIHNDCSPVRKGDEKIIDEALEKDRAHRLQIKDTIKYDEIGKKSVFRSLVDDLENDTSYFSDPHARYGQINTSVCFDKNNPTHLHTMRVESIVRIMEQLAQGVSHDDVKAVAPNLYNFYFEHAKPAIEKYISENKI